MDPKSINYSLAYAFADSVCSVVRNPHIEGFSDAVLSDFFDFRSEQFFVQIQKPQKKTLLHTFIFQINYSRYSDDIGIVGPVDYLQICEELIKSANMKKPIWLNMTEVENYTHELDEIISKACEVVTNAAFHLLFSDRSFLFEFNLIIGKYIALLNVGEHPCVASNGELRRVSYFPVWLKNAIFHRDKGRCQLCFKDLTNLLVPTTERHIDHMVPLKAHGTNDPTNLQLTCRTCNVSKGANVLSKKHLTYPFW